MLKNMKLSAKVGLGFGSLILIAVILGGMAVFNMKTVAVESTKLAREYVPEVDVAAEIRGASNRVMYAMRGYGFTENEIFYNDALEEIAAMEAGLADGRRLAATALNLEKLSGQLDKIEKTKADYKAAMAETRRLVASLDAQRKNLDQNAAAYIQNSSEFLAGQNEAFKRDLAERQKKVSLVSKLVNLGSEVRVLNFKAQASGNAVLMRSAISKLNSVNVLVDMLRKITRDAEDIQRIERTVAAAEGYQTAIQAYLNEFEKGAAAGNAALAGALSQMDANAAAYMENCNEFLVGQQEKLTIDMTERHAKITLTNEVIDLGNDTRIKAFKSQALRDPALMEAAEKNFRHIDQKFETLRKITRLEVDLARIDKVQQAAQGYDAAMQAFLADWKKLQALGETRNTLGGTMIEACIVLAQAGMDHTVAIADGAMHSLNNASTTMIIGLAVALVMGICLAIFITRGITRAINRVTAGLSEGADQVASAASQVSAASQGLAEGASEQAASIEETSSSLEEMSAMTQQNADNAGQANSLMTEANQVVDQANASMADLTRSMQEISQASEKTSKIIKTIDEIAFQTNLLALNAAVEAARAGEAGAGFAVVADEVRNLAMRAADAAKDTAQLIEGTVKKVGDGSDIVTRTNEAFGKVADSSRKVGDLVNEIAAASGEQAQGIEQVNTAVSEMGQVTQQNAASAEESASASEEMSAQAEQMQAMVNELVALVEGSRKAGFKPAAEKQYGTASPMAKPAKATPKSAHTPEQLIPLDDEEVFNDF